MPPTDDAPNRRSLPRPVLAFLCALAFSLLFAGLALLFEAVIFLANGVDPAPMLARNGVSARTSEAF